MDRILWSWVFGHYPLGFRANRCGPEERATEKGAKQMAEPSCAACFPWDQRFPFIGSCVPRKEAVSPDAGLAPLAKCLRRATQRFLEHVMKIREVLKATFKGHGRDRFFRF